MVMTLRKRAPKEEAAAEEEEEEEAVSWSRKKKSQKVTTTTTTTRTIVIEEEDAENGYEKTREQRIRENRARMEKLGLFSLSSQFASLPKPKPKPKPRPRSSSSTFSRRSSSRRVKTVGHCFETNTSLRDLGISLPDACKPELYSQLDESLLRNCHSQWTLNVDGYGDDGEPLYDPLNGTSCHQCRLKTIKKHTHCPNCRSSHGQLCGDCLYTRYGENVAEASLDSSWTCPSCRGICNCSRCRRSKGWPPVNILYSKVTQLGFRSVAHYLIFTRRAGAITKESDEATTVHPSTDSDTQAPFHPQGSDSSAEWLHSGDDDDDEDDDSSDDDSSKTHKKSVPQYLETHTHEAADKNQGFNDSTSNDCLLS